MKKITRTNGTGTQILTTEQWKHTCESFNEEILETIIYYFDDADDLATTLMYLKSQLEERKLERHKYFKTLEDERGEVEAVVSELEAGSKDQYFDENTRVARYTNCELDVILSGIKESMDRYDESLEEVLNERLDGRPNTIDEMELQNEDIHFLVVQREVEKRLIQKIQKQESYQLYTDAELR